VTLPADFLFACAIGMATTASAQFIGSDEHQNRVDETRLRRGGPTGDDRMIVVPFR
jgi:hypothetical protein